MRFGPLPSDESALRARLDEYQRVFDTH
jgi:hypothetical protein